MVKIKYVGDRSSIRIKALGSTLYWSRGEVKNLDKKLAEALLLNPRFSRVGKKPEEKKVSKLFRPKKVEEKEDKELIIGGD